MLQTIRDQVRSANEGLTASLLHIQATLSGQAQFQDRDVQALSAPIAEMGPLLEHAQALGRFDPELGSLLDSYFDRLAQIQRALDKLRIMLLATRSSLHSSQAQLEAVRQWSEAYRRTG